jgi:predicted ABC-type exoprotein transport system permease subunit
MDKMEILKKDIRIDTMKKVIKTISSVIIWLAMINLFLFIPLTFFNVTPLGLVFVNSIIIFCMLVGMVTLNIVMKKMMKDNILEMITEMKKEVLSPEDKEKLEEVEKEFFNTLDKIAKDIVDEDEEDNK